VTAIGVALAVTLVLCLVLLADRRRLVRRLRRAAHAEAEADARRARYLREAARELRAPIDELLVQATTPGARAATARVAAIIDALDPPAPARERPRLESIDVAALVGSLLEEEAATEIEGGGPSVVLRARPTYALADRPRLTGGLRVLLWALRRGAATVTLEIESRDGDATIVASTRGGRALLDALERLPAFEAGLGAAPAPAGTSLALSVAQEVARVHGGALRGVARGEASERSSCSCFRAPARPRRHRRRRRRAAPSTRITARW
jgi:hypothetical protein